MGTASDIQRTPSSRLKDQVSALGQIQRSYPIVQLGLLAAFFAYGSFTIDGFFSVSSVFSMIVLAALLGIAACGQTLLFLIGGLDLSVPAFIAAGSSLTIELSYLKHWPFIAAFALIAAVGMAVGGIAGLICYRFRVEPLIVTLATGAIVGGMTLVFTGGLLEGVPPNWLVDLASPAGKTFGIPLPPLGLVWAALAIVVGLILHRTVLGHMMYATGSNLRAAQLSLVRTGWIWVGTFAVSAVLSSVTGVLIAGFAGAGQLAIGQPYLWLSVTAVVLGGTALGGPGDYWRTVLGSLLLIVFSTIIIGEGFTPGDQQILYGVIIFVLVAFYGRVGRVRDSV